jgi:hypothetical protein
MIRAMSVEWRVEIKHDGIWPKKWDWMVIRQETDPYHTDLRTGDAFTKDGARRAALKAKRSMEDEDVRVVYGADSPSAQSRRADASAARVV